MHRAKDELHRQVAATFAAWGIPTVESLLMTCRGAPELLAIASGGVRDGIQMAKAIALGATACGVAGPFLHAASKSIAAVADLITVLVTQLRIAMFAAGAANVPTLKRTPLITIAP